MTRASEYRSRKRERLHKLYVEATGQTFVVRRVQVDAWIIAGRIPDTIAREVLEAWPRRAKDVDEVLENMSVDQLMKQFQALRSLIVYVCVSPKVITEDREADPDADEIHFVEIEPEECAALMTYCMNGTGATPIEPINGNLTPEVVTSFPESGERREPVPVSQNG